MMKSLRTRSLIGAGIGALVLAFSTASLAADSVVLTGDQVLANGSHPGQSGPNESGNKGGGAPDGSGNGNPGKSGPGNS